mmetsp:Transcript_17513/g.25871  ORF Transcript_17513/g.25871 Transcript_17513/m.25871 type:complete len:386 (-) Transcript_17513:1551-2708(-)
MTTAHRPTWKAAVGRAQEGGWSAGGAISTQSSSRDLNSHTKLKFRRGNQQVPTDRNAALEESLLRMEEAERKAQLGVKRAVRMGREQLLLENEEKNEEEGRLKLLKQTADVDEEKIRAKYNDDDDDDGEDDMAKSGISFHWDKDEDFRLLTGGSLYIHPHISTVTYLTDLGAPTMVLSKRVDPMSGAYVTDAGDDGSVSNVDGLVSFPKQGKHLSFDGRYLHAAPSDLLRDGLFEEQCKFDRPDGIDMKKMKVLERRHRRVSFLVNIWLNYHPYNVHPFPETMISNLSKMDLLGDVRLFDKCDEAKKSGDSITLKLKGEGKIQCEEGSVDEAHANVVTKNWPMGNCSNDCIDVPMPVDLMKSRNAGDDVKLIWRGEDIKLSGASA